ncbi:MAG: hypothetical protein GY940_46510 [bacterium]|nr:hypothetical protein [bacterium]
MAKRMQAIKAYSPKIKQAKTLQMDRLVEYLSGRTGLSEGAVNHVLMELRDSIAFFGLIGQAIKLNGFGTFTPKVQLDGTFDIAYRPDKRLRNMINAGSKFSAEIINKEMMGKTMADLIARWNEEHPDDPVED